MEGQIVKIISDNFYVRSGEQVILCKCRGKMRNNNKSPLVGDFVLLDQNNQVIVEILNRKNQIIRPPVANITKGILVMSFKDPDFSTHLLDKLLVELEINNIKPLICLTKKDLITDEKFLKYQEIINYYQNIGYKVLYNTNLKSIQKELVGEVSVFIGQTGAGKSTLLNKLFPTLNLKTGEISKALGRGKHTTRHVSIHTFEDMQVLDTPGFSALSFKDYSKEAIRDAFIEFRNYPCIYKDCMHEKENECMVKKACMDGKIIKSRYQNYLAFLEEWKEKR